MNAILKKKRNKFKTIIKAFFTFSKAQVSSFTGAMIDYGVMLFLTEVFGIHFTYTIVIGGIVGACWNFTLNKYWTFHSKKKPYKSSMRSQLVKFVLVAINSILLKSTGTYYITHFFGLDYRISRIVVDLFVSWLINFNMQRFWVFKK